MASDAESKGVYERPWGHYKVHGKGDNWALKTLHVSPDQATSLQTHARRDEYWMLVSGEAIVVRDEAMLPLLPFQLFHVTKGAKHRLIGGPAGCIVVEVMQGDYDENDITRIEDNYGRV